MLLRLPLGSKRLEKGPQVMSCRQRGNVAPVHPAQAITVSARGSESLEKSGNALEQRDVEHVPQGVTDVARLGGRRALLQVWRPKAGSATTETAALDRDSRSSSLSASWIDNDVNKWCTASSCFCAQGRSARSKEHNRSKDHGRKNPPRRSCTRRRGCTARGHSPGRGRARRGSTASRRPSCPSWHTSPRGG